MIAKYLIALAVICTASQAMSDDNLIVNDVPPYTLIGNISAVSQYVFRGLTQTNSQPAIQGGIDYAHSSGIYLGTWLSNISWYTDQNAGSVSSPVSLGSPTQAGAIYNNGRSNHSKLEIDIYGGYKKSISDNLSYDIGILTYIYPGTYENTGAYRRPDTTEIYGAINYKILTLKYSKAISSSTFGANDSKGASYLDATLTLPIEKIGSNLIAHIGRQYYPHSANTLYWGNSGGDNSFYSYTDYKVGLTKEALGLTFGASWSYANTKATAPDGETTAYNNAVGRNIGGNRWMISVTKNFTK